MFKMWSLMASLVMWSSIVCADDGRQIPSLHHAQRPIKGPANKDKPLSPLKIPEHPYQDVWVNGRIIAAGEGSDCEERYLAIKPVLDLYQRPFTVLDIGAAEGYFSFRIASEYTSCAVMIGTPSWNNDILQRLCEANKPSNVILLSKTITADELQRLSECEHFDVVLAFNVVHHFEDQWPKAYKAILNMGDNIFIETPPNGDKGACGQSYLTSINESLNAQLGTLLGQFQRRTDSAKYDRLIWLEKNRSALARTAYIFEPNRAAHRYKIVSDFVSKTLYKFNLDGSIRKSNWEPGINLLTFKFLNGTYPASKTLAKSVHAIAGVFANDRFPHNIVVQGNQLLSIDTHDGIDVEHQKGRRDEFLKYAPILRLISSQSIEEIKAICSSIYQTSIN